MVSTTRARQRYSEGQRVTATVEKVLPFGVFVRLADGTRAYIRRRELSLEGDRPPGEIVSEGQILQAVVLSPAEAGRLMELTVRAIHPDPWEQFVRRYKEQDVVTATVKHILPNGVFAQIIPGVNGFIPLEELASWRVEKAEDVVWTGDEVEAVITRIDPSRKRVNLSIRQRMEQLMRAEDVIGQVCAAEEMERIAGEPIEESVSSQEEMVGLVRQIDQILVPGDQGTVKESLTKRLTREGLRFLRRIWEWGKCMLVGVKRSPEQRGKHFLEIQPRSGITEHPTSFEGLLPLEIEIQTAQGLAEVMHSRLPLARRFHAGLEHLLETTRAEEAMVFHMDRTSHMVSIVASVGSIPINESATYALITSPVKDVILEGETIWENRVSQEQTRRFEKLLELLPFESCIGIPIEAGGQTKYALFLFHREPDAFSWYRLRDAWAMATFFAVAIEQDALDRRIQEISRVFLSGHLAAGLGHEIYNRLSGLDLEFQNLIADFEVLRRNSPELRDMPAAEDIRRALGRAAETAVGLKQLVGEFRRLLKAMEEEQMVDVNEVVHQLVPLIEPQARRTKVTVRFHLSPDVPPVAGSGVGLQHVLLNLMLNAIQHMALKPDERRVLEISTAWEDDARPVKIRVSDTGPGIHRQLWEKIFALGFTTKPGGSGLGLYIARSLVEAMGGRISVERSLVPLGTTFLVELPAASRK